MPLPSWSIARNTSILRLLLLDVDSNAQSAKVKGTTKSCNKRKKNCQEDSDFNDSRCQEEKIGLVVAFKHHFISISGEVLIEEGSSKRVLEWGYLRLLAKVRRQMSSMEAKQFSVLANSCDFISKSVRENCWHLFTGKENVKSCKGSFSTFVARLRYFSKYVTMWIPNCMTLISRKLSKFAIRALVTAIDPTSSGRSPKHSLQSRCYGCILVICHHCNDLLWNNIW